MLHKTEDVILPETWNLLHELQQDEMLADFFLLDGTALALHIGHRFSIDLDLFTLHPFDTQRLSEHLIGRYSCQISSVAKNTILGVIQGVKVDLITHAYPLVKNLILEDDLRLASVEDIGAMKLNAIAHSGQRLKDFIDIFFMLEQLPLNELLRTYEIKYPHSNLMIPMKGLTYFDDIDPNADPPILKRKIKIEQLQARLVAAVEKPDQVFSAGQ